MCSYALKIDNFKKFAVELFGKNTGVTLICFKEGKPLKSGGSFIQSNG